MTGEHPELREALAVTLDHYVGFADAPVDAELYRIADALLAPAGPVGKLQAELAAEREAMAKLGKAARAASDMLSYLRESEGVQLWHEDRLDAIDACIEAVEMAPSRGTVAALAAGESAVTGEADFGPITSMHSVIQPEPAPRLQDGASDLAGCHRGGNVSAANYAVGQRYRLPSGRLIELTEVKQSTLRASGGLDIGYRYVKQNGQLGTQGQCFLRRVKGWAAVTGEQAQP